MFSSMSKRKRKQLKEQSLFLDNIYNQIKDIDISDIVKQYDATYLKQKLEIIKDCSADFTIGDGYTKLKELFKLTDNRDIKGNNYISKYIPHGSPGVSKVLNKINTIKETIENILKSTTDNYLMMSFVRRNIKYPFICNEAESIIQSPMGLKCNKYIFDPNKDSIWNDYYMIIKVGDSKLPDNFRKKDMYIYYNDIKIASAHSILGIVKPTNDETNVILKYAIIHSGMDLHIKIISIGDLFEVHVGNYMYLLSVDSPYNYSTFNFGICLSDKQNIFDNICKITTRKHHNDYYVTSHIHWNHGGIYDTRYLVPNKADVGKFKNMIRIFLNDTYFEKYVVNDCIDIVVAYLALC